MILLKSLRVDDDGELVVTAESSPVHGAALGGLLGHAVVIEEDLSGGRPPTDTFPPGTLEGDDQEARAAAQAVVDAAVSGNPQPTTCPACGRDVLLVEATVDDAVVPGGVLGVLVEIDATEMAVLEDGAYRLVVGRQLHAPTCPGWDGPRDYREAVARRAGEAEPEGAVSEAASAGKLDWALLERDLLGMAAALIGGTAPPFDSGWAHDVAEAVEALVHVHRTLRAGDPAVERTPAGASELLQRAMHLVVTDPRSAAGHRINGLHVAWLEHLRSDVARVATSCSELLPAWE